MLFGGALAALFFVAQTISVSWGQPLSTQDDPNVEDYAIDNSHTSLVFAVSHFGLSYTYGRFNKCEGEFQLDKGELTTKGFSFTIDANSIDTNNEERDTHLRGPDFFDTERFDEIKFVTTGYTKENGVYKIKGDMTMLGQTKPLSMPVNHLENDEPGSSPNSRSSDQTLGWTKCKVKSETTFRLPSVSKASKNSGSTGCY
jgi:polyisoprenoid-binding protein YceI